MKRALVVCLVAVSGCSTPRLDTGSQAAAIKPAPSCEHIVCKPHHDDHDPKRAACCVSASASLGAGGGTVTTGDGTAVELPLGAVDSPTTITIHESSTPAPNGAVTPIIDFGPDGIVFAHPVKVTIPLARTSGRLTTFWTKHDGSGQFEPIGGTVVGSNMVVEVTHFSEGYVAPDPGVRTVTGTESLTWVGNPTQIVHTDLTALSVEALVPNGSGGYTSYPGSGTVDGLFTIPNIPVGTAIIHTGNLFTTIDVTTDTDVDLSRSTLGRPDETPADDASQMVFDVGNMTPWRDGDSLEFFCPQNNDWVFSLEVFGLFNFPVAGDTAIHDLYVPEPIMQTGSGIPGNLIQSQHDTCSMLHLQSRQTDPAVDNPPVTYLATIESFSPAPFDQIDAADTLIQGDFVSSPTPNSISVDLQMQKYLPLFGNAPAGASTHDTGAVFYLSAIFADANGITTPSSSADFLGLDVTANPVETVAHDMHYGLSSVAGSWAPFGTAQYGSFHTFAVPGTTVFATFQHKVFTTIDTSNPPPPDQPPINIEPRVGPPDSPKIAGLDVMQPQTGVGLTPTLTWNAPKLGTPNLYLVNVSHLTPTANGRNFTNVARIATTATSITLPAGLLVAGESYVLNMQAAIAKPIAKDPPPPATVSPFNANITDGANVISAIFQP